MKYLTNQVLSLISRIHTQSAEFTNSRLSLKGSFVSSHGFILFILSDGKPQTMGALAEKINRTKSTTTSLIKKLIQEGLVKTEPDPEDSRIKLISLTEKGMKYRNFTGEVSKELLDACWKDFSDIEKTELMRLLIKMSDNLS
ncbi:MarR family winged helix-turn-helix transcriptional regulator [Treponema sp.]|uniref:MarR family winged helix-turn-helix transcriptional regulator n=1 Tax=Treponema sp. TaxID=166 RepID=UPI00257AA1DB|nr:MarR family winged helix-turn-helix transcriptional regulator [Treponema sp.]MBE6354361.1 winged helix-turn-helix transcriptional regulator [Treponema sp.]